MITRRRFLTGTAAAAGGVSLLRGVIPVNAQTISPTATVPLAQPGRDYTPTITPNNVSLPWKIVDGAKVYHLIAEEVKHEFAPGLEAFCWGFNGQVHGRRRSSPNLRHQQVTGCDKYSLARNHSAQRNGWHQRPHPTTDQTGRNIQVRIHSPAARHAHVSFSS